MCMSDQVSFRFASAEDVPLILRFIRDLAAYEHMLDEVIATEALLKARRPAHVRLDDIPPHGQRVEGSCCTVTLLSIHRLLAKRSRFFVANRKRYRCNEKLCVL